MLSSIILSLAMNASPAPSININQANVQSFNSYIEVEVSKRKGMRISKRKGMRISKRKGMRINDELKEINFEFIK